MDASLRSAGQIGEAWMLRPAQHDQTDRVIPNAVRNPVHGCFAPLSMTNRGSVDASLRSA